MLALTRKTDYALIALSHMAQDAEGCSSAREMATRYQMPLPLLMNILKQLTRRGLAKSVRGPRGGYTLAAAPADITLHDIIRAVEGPTQLVQCIDMKAVKEHEDSVGPGEKTRCELVACCPVRSPIQRIHDRLVQFLESVTLADVAGPSACCGREPLQLTEAVGETVREAVHLSRL
jgi:Rrf2 family protein